MKEIFRYTDYEELLEDLKQKYGVPDKPYFTPVYKPVASIKRGTEGLFIHHDREDKVIMLSNVECNRQFNYPFEYHVPQNLTYANYMEHLMLHILISCRKEVLNKELQQEVGSGGIVNFFCPEINLYLSGAYEFKQAWKIRALSVFDGDAGYNTYIKCLSYLLNNYNGILYKNRQLLANACCRVNKHVYTSGNPTKAEKFSKNMLEDLLAEKATK